ncbi:MAG: glycosyltransferase [Verrucomicrobia bacterium]|nr:glycosyltransferase [Verrucomicrobiota bacterium]
MQEPAVSFVIPCYKLAHLLRECVDSILCQSYKNFEVLVMDDCSPDNTAEVARSFQDARVRYIRNDPNLGHLRNYNKGIGLSRGRYVWLISADDYLRKPYVLEKYVDVLERHPNVGYAFCPGFGVRDGVETRLLGCYRARADHDRIIAGHVLLKKLLQSNFILTPSVIVRRECYEKISLFELSMPWVGDWYLWCLFALFYDVAYFADRMVCYREQHALSMTDVLHKAKLAACATEEIEIPWLIRKRAQEAGYTRVAKACLSAVAHTYARTLASERYRGSGSFMNLEQFEESLSRNTSDETERDHVRARVYDGIGSQCYWRGELTLAREFYQAALEKDPWMVSAYIKKLLLGLGKQGDYLREAITSFR